VAQSSTDQFDAIVIGSGMSGGWAAKELCEAGLKVLMLDKGRDVKHGEYPTEHLADHELKFRGRGDRQRYARDHSVQSQIKQFGEATEHFFINDQENPYSVADGSQFTWIRGNQVGGRSLMWTRQTYRLTELDFAANAKDGYGVDWPIRYADIAPWYDYVEEFVGISGEANVSDQIPHGPLQPGFELNEPELKLRSACKMHFPERKVTIARVAVLTQAKGNRGACHMCGPCARGCSVGAYFSTQSATLPAAAATGNLTLRSNAAVSKLIYDETKNRIRGVSVVDTQTGKESEFYARTVFLCASAFESVRLLLNSGRADEGLANSSGTLGHYLMDHHFSIGATAEITNIKSRYYNGNRPAGFVVPRFRNITEQREDYIRGFQMGGNAAQVGWPRGINQPGTGETFKKSLSDPGPWSIYLTGAGEMLPRKQNRMTIDAEKRDAWGIPVPCFDVRHGSNEQAMRSDIQTCAGEMLEAAGFKNTQVYDNDQPPGKYIHEMGGARMGHNPATSVLNAHNQSHDIPNLFVTDGSCMSSSGNQNPSLTYMALTARAAHFAIEAMKNNVI
jgi:choline dehydrogenase-like flavoprotein